jgi:flagellar motor component MotA
MEYQKRITTVFRRTLRDHSTTVALISGIVLGATIGSLIVIKNRKYIKNTFSKFTDKLLANLKNNNTRKAKEKLGALIEDVRLHVKQNAAGLLG